jgi:hypothetical protein
MYLGNLELKSEIKPTLDIIGLSHDSGIRANRNPVNADNSQEDSVSAMTRRLHRTSRN